jgi:UrcA family protein
MAERRVCSTLRAIISTPEYGMKRATLALLLSSMALAGAPLAQAEDAGDKVLKRIVDYSDINLSHQDGASELYGRLKVAAKAVCSPLDRRGGEYSKAHRACVQGAVDSAVGKVNQPTLSAWHQSQTGRIVSSSVQASIARP